MLERELAGGAHMLFNPKQSIGFWEGRVKTKTRGVSRYQERKRRTDAYAALHEPYPAGGDWTVWVSPATAAGGRSPRG